MENVKVQTKESFEEFKRLKKWVQKCPIEAAMERSERVERVDTDLLTVNILIEYQGEVHMVAMKKDNFEAVSFLAKRSVDSLIKTGKTQVELLEFLGYKNKKAGGSL